MDATIAAVLRQAAAAIGEPDRAAHVERVACEARAGDLAYLSGEDSDESDDDGWEYAACPDAEQRFEAVESALANRYASSTVQDADLDAVGTPQDDVDRMAKRRALPLALEELYLSARDGIWFEDKELIALQACGKLLGEIDEPYFPFARDVDDNMLVVNCKNEAVYEWDLADGRGDEVERSITDYLEGYRNKLLENKYEYMDGDGCIEKAGGSSAPPPRGK